MTAFFSYMMADLKFFESPAYIKSKEDYATELDECIANDWKVRRRDYWYDAIPNKSDGAFPLQSQGFKIHLSGTVINAHDIMRAAVPILVRNRVRFKVVANGTLLSHINSKNYGRGASGKFFTIYPHPSQFESLIRELSTATSEFNGPYILSDKRFPGSKIVYYRYGGFMPVWELSADGSRSLKLSSPDNALIDDERKPFFSLPTWVQDPFPEEIRRPSGARLLKDRYAIRSVIKFSNTGGVYRAHDHQTGMDVVIKEARPHTNVWRSESGSVDALDLLQHEYDALILLKTCDCVVRPVDFFKAWEHSFLVLESVPGIELRRIRSHNDFSLIPFRGGATTAKKFTKKFVAIGTALISTVKAIHAHGVIIGDLSPGNILVDKRSLKLTLIDFETSRLVGKVSASDVFARAWNTTGMRQNAHGGNRDSEFSDDWHSVAMSLQSMLLPVEAHFGLNPDAPSSFLNAITRDAGLPSVVTDVVNALKSGHPDVAADHLKKYTWSLEDLAPDAARFMSKSSPTQRQQKLERVHRASRESLIGITKSILASANPQRPERMWPLDYEVFESHGFGVGVGSAGPLAYLSSQGTQIGADLLDAWQLGLANNIRLLPPGLFNGLAGAAYTLGRAGRLEKALEIHGLMHKAALVSRDPSFCDGVAGCIWASLSLHKISGDQRYLEVASALTNHLMTLQVSTDGDGFTWKSEMYPDRRGVAYGAAGIALVATQLCGAFPEETRFRNLAITAFHEDFDPSKDSLRWAHTSNKSVVSPYWLTGAAGMAAVACRVSSCKGDPKYAEIAEAILRKNASLYAVLPGQLEGLSGIGEAFLDLFQVTGNKRHQDSAFDIAASILLYEIRDTEGVWYPGRHLYRRSHDFSYGAAGVGLYLHRLIEGGGRFLHDI